MDFYILRFIKKQDLMILLLGLLKDKMRYCKLCVQPNTRPNSYFTTAGICQHVITIKNLKNKLNKIDLLKKIVKKYKVKI